MADKNIGRYNSGTVTPTTHVVAIETAPSSSANVDPVLIPAADLGGEGPSAYDVAVDNGFVGDEPAWLASLVGPTGGQGPAGGQGPRGEMGPSVVPDEYGIFNEAKVAQIAAANVEWNMLIIANGDQRANKTQPATLNGDMSGHLVRYEPGTPGTWLDLGPIVGIAGPQGNDGPQGPGGEDGAKGDNGDSAYTIAVNNGFVGTQTQWLNSLKGADGEDGTNGTNGTDGEDGAKGDKGDPGGRFSQYNVTIARSANPVAVGGYPLTYYAAAAATLTKLYGVIGNAGGGTTATVMVTVNDVEVWSGPLTSTPTIATVSIDVAVGDRIMCGVISTDARYIALTLTEELED